MSARGGRCRHYSFEVGASGGPRCALGIDIVATHGSVGPCMPKDGLLSWGTCLKREEFTAEETAAAGARVFQFFEDLDKVMALVPGSNHEPDETWGGRGTFPCPVCGGTVSWSREACDGRLSVRCSTRSCVAMKE